jgi:hypothetical protein
MKTLAATNNPPLQITPYGQQPSDSDDVIPIYEDVNWVNYYSRYNFLLGMANDSYPYRVQGGIFTLLTKIKNFPGIFFLDDNTPSNVDYIVLYNDTSVCPLFSLSCSEPSNYKAIMQVRAEQAIGK